MAAAISMVDAFTSILNLQSIHLYLCLLISLAYTLKNAMH